jgi:DnaK suppressor protein
MDTARRDRTPRNESMPQDRQDLRLASFRERLLRERDTLVGVAESAAASERPVELDQTSVGRLSRMDAMQMQQMALASARRRNDQLARIDAALRRLENGEFGICVACGDPIDPRRLDAEPTAIRCLECARRGVSA